MALKEVTSPEVKPRFRRNRGTRTSPGSPLTAWNGRTRRHVLANGFTGKAEKVVREGGWNDVTVRAMGLKITITVNGLKTVEYAEPDPDRPREGVIALQLHRGPCMEVHYRDIRIRSLAD